MFFSPQLFRLKTGIADVTGALKERRSNAKMLLSDIEEKLGKEKMTQLLDIIKGFHQRSSSELLTEIDGIFEGVSDLQTKFMDFLPSHLR
jgi:hypothetical protein